MDQEKSSNFQDQVPMIRVVCFLKKVWSTKFKKIDQEIIEIQEKLTQ